MSDKPVGVDWQRQEVPASEETHHFVSHVGKPIEIAIESFKSPPHPKYGGRLVKIEETTYPRDQQFLANTDTKVYISAPDSATPHFSLTTMINQSPLANASESRGYYSAEEIAKVQEELEEKGYTDFRTLSEGRTLYFRAHVKRRGTDKVDTYGFDLGIGATEEEQANQEKRKEIIFLESANVPYKGNPSLALENMGESVSQDELIRRVELQTAEEEALDPIVELGILIEAHAAVSADVLTTLSRVKGVKMPKTQNLIFEPGSTSPKKEPLMRSSN